MSAHSHDDHGHAAHGHEEHGHGHDHAEHWGDYNAQPPGSTSLPPISPIFLALFGVALAVLLSAIVLSSMSIAVKRHSAPHAHDTSGHGESHGAHDEKKEEAHH